MGTGWIEFGFVAFGTDLKKKISDIDREYLKWLRGAIVKKENFVEVRINR